LLLIDLTIINVALSRSSLNVKNATIIKELSAGSSITSGSTLMKLVVVLLTLVVNMFKGSLEYVFPFPPSSLLFFYNLTPGNKLQASMTELRTLLKRFANNKSLDIIIDAIDAIIDDTRRDQALREWFKSIDTYIRKVLSSSVIAYTRLFIA